MVVKDRRGLVRGTAAEGVWVLWVKVDVLIGAGWESIRPTEPEKRVEVVVGGRFHLNVVRVRVLEADVVLGEEGIHVGA